jgi:hypothetical protein
MSCALDYGSAVILWATSTHLSRWFFCDGFAVMDRRLYAPFMNRSLFQTIYS